ncbi:MAG: MBL fold metallo-hydrolase [Eubacteriales bacterium]|nr:MBL fold metallo-hydrolase [Eubacteriales bacterium]
MYGKSPSYATKRKRLPLGLAAVVILCVLFTAALIYIDRGIEPPSEPMEGCTVLVPYTGDAMCAIIKAGDMCFMIDTGSYADRDLTAAALKRAGVEKVDMLVISHSHADHFGGYPALKGIKVDKVFISPFRDGENSFYQDCLEFFSDKGSTVAEAPMGESVSFGDIIFTFLGPVGEYEDINDMSVVVRMSYGAVSVLFPGDMTGNEANDIMDTGAILLSDVFIASHHGSAADGANSYRLLREVMPSYVIISSAGKSSSHGYPHEVFLSRLKDLGCEVHRTDLEGDVVFVLDGNKVVFR